MLRDFKFLRRNSSKNEEIENVPVNPRDSSGSQTSFNDASSRPPLNTLNPRIEQEPSIRTRVDRTPTKQIKSRNSDQVLPLRTPDKHGVGYSSKQRFGWGNRNESSDDLRSLVTPRGGGSRVSGRGNGSCSESNCNSTQSTPTKSVNKPPNSGFRSKFDWTGNGNVRGGNFAALYRGIPSSSGMGTVVNTVEVPHFDLKEDPSFWMDHNVQVLIRVRPLNGMEKATQGYNRCLKQETAQSITWTGQLETRFTFDHVACETVDQEMLFRMAGLPMVENCLSGYNSCMFAYGQTGSGKTYTMLGEIDDLEVRPSPHRGMTPRIFEFLFARIQAEEESRRDEKLKYNCKCSFLEIYNEQITDLLDPSSTNLMLREDVKKGVYVENLSEFEVQTVGDILKLLTQGSLNRRVAATNMNRESSRSHSVFTCVIESRWEKDSTTNLRFARLNLVDLAGSERQKTSGAEGERLKEAANINKSLSTLGHVIMILVDLAHGKPKHVPYRDSRLTFLLQDSLGGNSKTMIIANVSPSICCAAETLNTLKFAQRAKLIQNNAVVNEDATGDVIALQHQIRLLKEELLLLKRQNISRSLSFGSISLGAMQVEESTCTANKYEMDQQPVDFLEFESKGIVRLSTKQLKSLETTLAGALRREQMAETSIKNLEAEMEQLNRLVRQREEDTRSTKMMLRFREDKIQRMESLLGGSLPADSFLMEENRALSEEIQLLQAKVDKNPEVTRFALENIRLLDQVRRFQEFYEEGERDILMVEISNLRDQLLQFLDGKSKQHNDSKEAVRISKENDSLQFELKTTLSELEKCKNNLNSCLEENAKLSREIFDLRNMLNNVESASDSQKSSAGIIEGMLGTPTFELSKPSSVQNVVEEMHDTHVLKHAEEIMNLQLELDILKIILNEEKSFRAEVEERETCFNRDLELAKGQLLLLNKQYEDVNIELKEAKSVIEALESQQILSINEMEDLQKKNTHYVKRLSEQELEMTALKEQISCKELRDYPSSDPFKSQDLSLQAKLKRMHDSLDKAKQLNMWYQNDRDFHVSNEEEMDEICRQAEAETAEVIVCMQEELSVLQQQVQDYCLKQMEAENNVIRLETELKELQEKLALSTEKNEWLLGKLEEKNWELRTLSEEWEVLAGEVEEVMACGNNALIDASDQLDLISSSFPQKRIWISEQVGRLINIISEKEILIEELGRYLEDANNKRGEVECMLKSLRGAALVISEAHQQECNEKEQEILLLLSELRGKTSTIAELEDRMKMAEEHISKLSVCATAAFAIVNRQSETAESHLISLKHKDIQLEESVEMNQKKDTLLTDQAVIIEQAEKQIESLRKEVAEMEQACAELGRKLSEEEQRANAMEQKLGDIEETDILQTREKLSELKVGVSTLRSCIGLCLEDDKIPERYNADADCSTFDGSGEGRLDGETKDDDDVHFVEDLRNDVSKHCVKAKENFCSYPCDQKQMVSRNICNDVHERDATIVLLRMEIESALKSLREVQAEMAKLHVEKEEMLVSKKQNEKVMKCFVNQLLTLQATMDNFEKQSKLKIEAVNQKLGEFEHNVHEAGTDWCQTKEFLEHEFGDAKIVAVQKAAEASCIFAKFEEAQDTMKEADIMINGLLIANETMKLDVERLKQTQVKLKKERNTLINEVQSLQSINDLKDQQLENLEKQFGTDLTEARDLVVELEGLVADLQTTYREKFMLIAHDFQNMKSVLLDSTNLVRSWLDDVWSEIIIKDCAMAVLHLCHMGLLLETVTGLNAENGLLQHGLSESNSVIGDLREHNFKSRRELEMCRVLKGKLLADIKNSFDRISRKEEETGELCVKLITFEKKVSDLQLQEEMMFQRSNDIGSQLAVLMKDLDLSHMNVVASLLDQEKLLKDKEEVLNLEAELLMVDLCSKDLESLVLASELEEMALQKAEAEKKNIGCFAVIENLKKEMIVSNVEAELKEELYSLVLHDLEEKKAKFESSLSRIDTSEMEKHRLKDKILSLEACIANLQTDLEMKNAELSELQHSQSDIMKDLCLKNRDVDIHLKRVSVLTKENASLRNHITHLGNETHKAMSISSVNILKCLDSVKSVEMMGNRLSDKMHEGFMISDTMFQEICENAGRLFKFTKDFESLESHVKELMSENKTLQAELLRKDEVLEGLSFDLSLLQESASNTKDKKDEIEEVMASLEALEDDLEQKSSELDQAVAHSQMLEAQLQERINRISTLESDISREQETLKLLSCENLELRAHIEDTLSAKTSIEEELAERMKINESLEVEVEEMGSALGRMNDTIESLRSHLNELTEERDHLHLEWLSLNEKLQREQLRAEENEATALEAQQLAESRKIYAEEKEVEVGLLERSVEELECTINVLENKVDIVKEEAERQRLQREELELELNALNHQMQNVENADANTKRRLDEKGKSLQEALKQIQILERDITNKDTEIAQCKAHISELNLHAEAQASEYKQKFKALEAMVEQVRADSHSTQVTNSSSNKVERNASKHKGSGSPLNALKPRGSGSPFKCMGLGLAQQMKSEKDEELTVSRMRIEELESLAVSRQKEIFTLKARLASAESMTHDVIRDLLGVKLDMTNYMSLLDNQQVQKITEKARLNGSESQVKDQEVIKQLKQQLNEFIEERRGWLEEIDRKQAELVTAQIALEKLRQQDQSLRTENEMLKMENVKYKKMVMELEGEVKKLSGQQNLHQRIHHHAKIKEENNMLKIQNEDLSAKLRRSEVFLSRVKEELAQYRASIGKNPYINFDEEHRLNNKLKETEEERMQLAQKLLGLCTSILKAAGITRVVTDISPDVAEDALEQLKNRVTSQERELQNLKFKVRINSERNRLSEIMPQSSPTNTRTDGNFQSPRRVSQAPSLSALDR